MSATLFDPTSMGSAEQALEFIGNVLASSTEYSIIGKDLDGKVLLWNEGARRIYGYEPEEVVGLANSSILHTPEDVQAGRPREIINLALRDGKWEGTIKRVRKNGQQFTARVVITPRYDHAAGPSASCSSPRTSPTRRASPKKSARPSSSTAPSSAPPRTRWTLSRNVLESSTEYSIIGKDLDGKILLWNEGARRIYGYEPEEVVGLANSSILHTPEDVQAGMPREILNLALRDGKWEGTIKRVRKNGQQFTARCRHHPSPRRRGPRHWLPAHLQGHLGRDPAHRAVEGHPVLHPVADRVEH